MAAKIGREQKNMAIIKASMAVGLLMCFGFAYILFEIMGL